MEDQVVPQLVKAGKSTADEYAKSAVDWLNTKWFNLAGYLRWKSKPVLLIFGPQYYKDAELTALFGQGTALFTLLGKRGPATGGFGWPEPQVGDQKSWTQLRSFYTKASKWSASIPVAYPRFEDIYKAAGVGPGYGEIGDRDGATFKDSLALAEASKAPFIQIATWNDWGEGTQIEPSEEFGYRDLEILQEQRRHADPGFMYRASDLRLPSELYRLRKKGVSQARLSEAAHEILSGQCSKASAILKSL